MSPPARRIAVYGEIDLNLVDGSAVWTQSVCAALASIDGVRVTLLLRRPIEADRSFLVEELAARDAVEIVDAGRADRLAPDEALDMLARLDSEGPPFDVVLLRGSDVLEQASQRSDFDGRLWPYLMTGRRLGEDAMRRLAGRSHRVLCQTDAVARELEAIAPALGEKALLLPPMIPEPSPTPPAASDRPAVPEGAANDQEAPLRLVYSGKIAPEYCWLETVEAFAALREALPSAELHVLGDKVHRPPDRPDFHDAAIRALRETPGVHWHGAMPRAEVQRLLPEYDIALSVRDPSVDGARELSTKVLEYGAAGLPVVLNRAPVYDQLLGSDYPLFISGPGEAAAVLTGPALDLQLRSTASAACRAASAEYTVPRIAERLGRELPPRPALSDASRTLGDRPRVLVAGHDLKFMDPIRSAIAAAGAKLDEDLWDNHGEHSPRASRTALSRADSVLCEWCLGNAVWYSHNVSAAQRLTVRLHRMEVYSPYPAQVDIEAVDTVVFVSEHILEAAVERFGWDRDRLRVIRNAVDCDRLRREKSAAARFNIVLIGYVPMRKRLDLALDLLEDLRRHEPRFRMAVVGRPPSDFEWVVRRDEEVESFRQAYARIQESDLLRGAVELRPFNDDLPTLLEDVGWIVSTSDAEGHQVSLAEGAASGAVPVVLDRPGARAEYPDRWVHASTADAAEAVLAVLDGDLDAERVAAADHATRWAPDRILPQWIEILGLGDRDASAVEAQLKRA